MHHASISGRHRLEGDDLAVTDRLFAKALGHGRERVIPTAAIAFRVYGDVSTFISRAIQGAIGQKLQSAQHLPLFADDPAGVRARNF